MLAARSPKKLECPTFVDALVYNVGDTPSDLESGRRAGCGRSLGVTNGAHSRQSLTHCRNDRLFTSLIHLTGHLQARLALVQ